MVQEAEAKHWKQLSMECMTEESDDPTDPNAIVIHPLPWRSESEYKMCFSVSFYTVLCLFLCRA